MSHKTRVAVRAREKAVVTGAKQSFQAEIVPNAVLEGEALYEKLGNRTAFGASRAKLAIQMIESFVMEELAEGNRLDFGLVSFYPRLSSGLPTRDADPASEGIDAFGAVKARRELQDCLRRKLDLTNELSNVRPRVFGIAEVGAASITQQKWGMDGSDAAIQAGRTYQITGSDIPIDRTRADEGVWLEKRTRGKVAEAEVLESAVYGCKVVFRETPPKGKYTLVVGTRCGKGTDFKIRRCLLDVRVA